MCKLKTCLIAKPPFTKHPFVNSRPFAPKAQAEARKPHRIRFAQKDLSRASIHWYVRENQSGTVSSTSRFQTVLLIVIILLLLLVLVVVVVAVVVVVVVVVSVYIFTIIMIIIIIIIIIRHYSTNLSDKLASPGSPLVWYWYVGEGVTFGLAAAPVYYCYVL